MKMAIDKIFVMNTTSLSLSDRFTILQRLRSHPRPPAAPRPPSLAPRFVAPRRLADRIGIASMTPVARAAFALQKSTLMSRMGKSKLTLQRRGVFRPSPRSRPLIPLRRPRPLHNQRPLSRSNSLGNLSRSNSMSNLSDAGGFRGNSTRRGRGARGGRGRGAGQIRSQSRGRAVGGPGRGRGQKSSRGRQSGPNRNSFRQRAPASKEELDQQLEQYMAGTRSRLDMELDTYMTNAMDLD